MPFKIILFVLLLITQSARAQRCDCVNELNYLIHRIETISPSYFDQVNDQNRPQYTEFKKQCNRLAQQSATDKRCMCNGLGLSVERVGFTPDKSLTQYPEQDWIDLVREDLERQK